MIFIIMVNGNGRPPACKMQEARTGNYIPIWSGLIMDHLQSEHPLSGNQWGFQASKSTISALLGTCHSWLEILEKGKKLKLCFSTLRIGV